MSTSTLPNFTVKNIVFCPFDAHDSMPSDTFQKHLITCPTKRKVAHLFSVCKFNATHYILKEKIDAHEKYCKDAQKFISSKSGWDIEDAVPVQLDWGTVGDVGLNDSIIYSPHQVFNDYSSPHLNNSTSNNSNSCKNRKYNPHHYSRGNDKIINTEQKLNESCPRMKRARENNNHENSEHKEKKFAKMREISAVVIEPVSVNTRDNENEGLCMEKVVDNVPIDNEEIKRKIMESLDIVNNIEELQRRREKEKQKDNKI